VLERVVAAGSYAPTGSNKQNVELVVLSTPERVADLRGLTEELLLGFAKNLDNPIFAQLVAWKEGRDLLHTMRVYTERLRWLIEVGRKSPYFALPFGSAVLVGHCEKKDSLGHVGTMATLENCARMGEAEGLGSCYLGFVIFGANFDKRIRKLLGIPKNNSCHGAMVLGYPDVEYLRPIKRVGPSVTWL
jgi:nitroreductase